MAVGVLGLALTALLSGLSAGSIAVSRTEERVTAENLARSELEYVKSLPYEAPGGPYPTIAPSSDNYSVDVVSEPLNGAAGIEKVTVTIDRNDRELLAVEDYKVDR